MAQGSMAELLGEENLYRITVVSRKTGEEIEETIPEADLQSRIDYLRRDNLPIIKVEMALKSLEDVFMDATAGDSK